MGTAHEHQHDHDHDHDHRPPALRRLAWTAALNATLAVVQVVVGLASGSVAVLADAVHQCVDVVGIGLAVLALMALRRRPTPKRTFGWTRSDPLAAGVSMLLLVASLAWVGWEAVDRLRTPHPVEGGWVLAIGVIGLVINAGGAMAIGGHHHDHGSVRAARLHLLGDAAGSAMVVVTGALISAGAPDRVDPIAALVVCVLVAWSALGLLRRSSDELLDAVPHGVELDEIVSALSNLDGVEGVHHVHVWSLGAGRRALSAHLDVDGRRSTHETTALIESAQTLVRDRFAISHSTFQPECHTCEQPTH